ncbi:MAG TPA: anthranilate synthase component I, partial [Acidimicrobiaceae bacterium]|nr:anthranilate synthase component I [Acidimicrobiaceae bacterium]
MTTTLEEFSELAKEYTVIPVWKELVADYITPVAAFTRVVGDGDGFLLESVEHGERWSRWSFIGRNPLLTVKKKNGEIEVLGDSPIETPDDGKLLAFINALQNRLTSPVLEELPPMHSGIMGYVGYDLIREIEDLPNTPHDDLAIPESILSVIGELAVFDHWKQRVVLIANAIVPQGSSQREMEAAYVEAVNRLELLATDGARSIQEPLLDPPIVNGELPPVQSTMTKEEYCSAVEVAKEHILAGDIFQVV